jgi:uncharacterized protein YdeI (YjbR/CyaY-like superfamily)
LRPDCLGGGEAAQAETGRKGAASPLSPVLAHTPGVAVETGKDGKPILQLASPEEWEAWLEREHATSDGVWLKFAKKGSGVTTVVYAEALDVALCFGWIDSQVMALDEHFYLQKFTPRRSKSKWSRINVEKIEALTKAGCMRPAGLDQVELAKADGRWDAAYASSANVTEPADLEKALKASPKAAEFWAGLNKSNRFAIVYQLEDGKKPETRERRLAKFIGMLERGEKLY